MKKIVAIMLSAVSIAAFAAGARKQTSCNWRCSNCHTAYKRITYWESGFGWDVNGRWVDGGWRIVGYSACPGCGSR